MEKILLLYVFLATSLYIYAGDDQPSEYCVRARIQTLQCQKHLSEEQTLELVSYQVFSKIRALQKGIPANKRR